MDSPSPAGVATKIVGIGKKIAPIFGIVHGFLGDPMADGRGFTGAPQFMYDRVMGGLGKGKFANPLITTQMALQYPDRYPIMSGIVAAITGWLMDYAGKAIDQGVWGQMISGLGQMTKRYGVAAAVTSIPAAWLWLGEFNPHGTPGYSQGVSKGTSTSSLYREAHTAHIRSSSSVSSSPR